VSVQIIENWTVVDGRVRGLEPAADAAGYMVAEVEVLSSRAVEGFANLVAAAPGALLRVYVSEAAAAQSGLAAGAHIVCRMRRGGPQRIFAHPTDIRVV
jgi:hypothetical protein